MTIATLIAMLGKRQSEGGPPPAPDTFASLFGGLGGGGKLWLVNGDPNEPDFEPVTESDRYRWRDTSGCGNDRFQMLASVGGPLDGNEPGTATVDGHTVPFFDGSTGMSLFGWLSATPTGENWLARSELFDSDFWTGVGTVPSAGPAPHAATGCTQSTTLTDAVNGSNIHYVDQPYPSGSFGAGPIYCLSFFARKGSGNDWFAANDDVNHIQWFNLANGTLGNTVGDITDPSITHVADGWYRCRYKFRGHAGAKLRLYMAATNGAVVYVNNGSTVHVTGFDMKPSREAGWTPKPYVKTTSARLQNPSHSACTVVLVAQSGSGGPRAILETSGGVYSHGTNTMHFAQDTSSFLTEGLRANGTSWSYSRANGALDCHICVCDPVTNEARIYRKGVKVATFSGVSGTKYAGGAITGKLFGGLWQLGGVVPFVAYFGGHGASDAEAATMSAYLAGPTCFPSISA